MWQSTRRSCEHSGLNTTSYLQDICNIDFLLKNKTGKFKGFAFIRAPAHVIDELIKPDGITYYGNNLRVEDTISTRKRTNNNTSSESWRSVLVVNNHPKNQHLYRKSSASESKPSKREKSYFWWQHPLWHQITSILLLGFMKVLLNWNHFLVAHIKNFYTMWNQHWKTKYLTWFYCMLVLMTYLSPYNVIFLEECEISG